VLDLGLLERKCQNGRPLHQLYARVGLQPEVLLGYPALLDVRDFRCRGAHATGEHENHVVNDELEELKVLQQASVATFSKI